MLDLFGFSNDPAINLLPCDGEVHYFGRLVTKQQADDYYNELMSNIAWENDQAIIFGKRIITKRKVAWYGDKPFQKGFLCSGSRKWRNCFQGNSSTFTLAFLRCTSRSA